MPVAVTPYLYVKLHNSQFGSAVALLLYLYNFFLIKNHHWKLWTITVQCPNWKPFARVTFQIGFIVSGKLLFSTKFRKCEILLQKIIKISNVHIISKYTSACCVLVNCCQVPVCSKIRFHFAKIFTFTAVSTADYSKYALSCDLSIHFSNIITIHL